MNEKLQGRFENEVQLSGDDRATRMQIEFHYVQDVMIDLSDVMTPLLWERSRTSVQILDIIMQMGRCCPLSELSNFVMYTVVLI